MYTRYVSDLDNLILEDSSEPTLDWDLLTKADFNESEHPRDSQGRFISGGGSYRRLKEQAATDEEIHHMPANESSPLHALNGPAIRMSKQDHMLTASYGTSRSAREYRQEQKRLIVNGQFHAALEMDITDLHSKFGSKYDKHIEQLKAYVANLKFSKRSNMPLNPSARKIKAGKA